MLGAVDGKHVRIQAPANSGTLFFNYKKYFSVVFLAVCNANYEFTMVDIGESGRQSDGGIFSQSKLGHCINNNLINLPDTAYIENTGFELPYVFIGDDAFSLKTNLMKPYPSTNLTTEKLICNYRFCRARRIIENAFGILTAVFRIFHRPINTNLKTTENIIKSCTALHNYLMADRIFRNQHCPEGFVDGVKGGHCREITKDDTGMVPFKHASNNYSTKGRHPYSMCHA